LILIIITFFVLLRAISQKKKLQLSEKTKLLAEKEKQQVLDNQEKEFNYARLEGQDKERDRIAKDLHDRLGSILSMVKLHYQSVEDELEELKLGASNHYKEANLLLDQACGEVRKIAYDINSGKIAQFGLIAAIDDLVKTLEEKSAIRISFIHSGIDNPLANEMEISLFRIIQELISNILKHAYASEVAIQFIYEDDVYSLTIEDDGYGFDLKEKKNPGMGLENVAARVEQLSGKLSIESDLGKGTFVSIHIPTKQNYQ